MGLYQIAKAVSFLNNECSLVRPSFGTELISFCLLLEAPLKLFWQLLHTSDV